MKKIFFISLFLPFTSYTQSITGVSIPETAKTILKEIMLEAGATSVVITSACRSEIEQVNVMYDYIKRYGIGAAINMYGPEGDSVVMVYENEKKKMKVEQLIKETMLNELIKQLPQAMANNRLMHVGRCDKFIVFDLSIPRLNPPICLNKFEEIANQYVMQGKLLRYLGTANGEKDAMHFEIAK